MRSVFWAMQEPFISINPEAMADALRHLLGAFIIQLLPVTGVLLEERARMRSGVTLSGDAIV